jgi:uncharacterized protein YjiS (DUF1127 family)
MSGLLIRRWISVAAYTAKTNVIRRSGHLTKPSVGLPAKIRSWIARSRQRQVLSELAERNDYLLKDIGVTQNEARREAAKWFWQQ